MSERTTHILAGLIALIAIVGSVYAGVKIRAAGALRPVYHVNASFSAAGQGLQSQSDVKIHGVNIGHVRNVRLRDGRALVRMDIDTGQHIPLDAKATIRPKTLFGEKFVDIDPGAKETSGPFLGNNGVIKETVGGFELERILSELYPILQSVKPEELNTVLHTLAGAGEGEGPAINRQLANFSTLADLQARHDADTAQFLDDLALLSDTLANRADDLVQAAKDLNVALPPLNQRGDNVTTTLDQLTRLSTDLADLFNANHDFFAKVATEGGKPVQVLYDRRPQIGPLLRGLREFFQVLAEVTNHIPKGDGTQYAAVKFIIGEECPQARVNCGSNQGTTDTAPTAAKAKTAAAKAKTPVVPRSPAGLTNPLGFVTPTALPAPASGMQGVDQLVRSLIP
ncbi:MAG TPA: MlaD family protein [Acidimicrobiales bacterium]|nr:MlaD family protein [Acidimicrobiales bacterium]